MINITSAAFDKFYAFFISLLVATAILLFASHYFKNDFKEALSKEVTIGIDKFDTIAREVATTLVRLNQLPNPQCSEHLLLSMRQEMYLSHHIKDIGFYQNDQLTCTTGLGKVTKPFQDLPPDYTDSNGFIIYVKRPIALFEHESTALIVRYQAFNAVIKLESLAELIDERYKWEVVSMIKQTSFHLAGTENIYSGVHQPDYFHASCSDISPYCIGLLSNRGFYKKQYRESYYLVYLLVTCFTLISYVSMRKFFRSYRSLKSRLKRGFNNDAFYCLYQPIVELESGRIVGCEVLSRYTDRQGPVYPDQFIPVINRLGLTWQFTDKVIKQTLSDINQQDYDFVGLKFNLNFFAKDISDGNILNLLNNVSLQQSDVNFVVEITEDEQLATQACADTLNRLSKHGYQIAVDDFGTGYSNLNQLRDFHCDILKIDRSFISEMEDGSIRSTLIPHIVDIARLLNLKIVAEGVENEMQRAALLKENVEFAQGWLFGKPMTLDEFVVLLKSTNTMS